jgi:3-oxoacyl-[acyl-carrier protein] reductase
MQLSDLKVIVTGGASGMGKYFAERLHEAGALVAVGDVNEAGLGELPNGILHRKLDVSAETECRDFVDWAHAALGGANALINNAGLLRDALLVKRDRKTGEIVKMSTESWRQVLSVNLDGATFMVRELVAKMAQEEIRPGVIVNISSIARHGNRGQSSYAASKAALAANTLTWAREFAPFGIRVVAVAPGMIETPMTQAMNPKALAGFVEKIPVGRIGKPKDIWQAVRFTIECDYFNSRCIDVDGGIGF